jgi:hypothetical protein
MPLLLVRNPHPVGQKVTSFLVEDMDQGVGDSYEPELSSFSLSLLPDSIRPTRLSGSAIYF